MASFPVLKTGAIVQYPVTRTLEHSTQVLRFVDGSEQRFRDFTSPLRRWVIRLDLLDEEELAQIEDFFLSAQGRLGSFTFTDPWDGTVYSDCSLESDTGRFGLYGPGRAEATLVIKENRG